MARTNLSLGFRIRHRAPHRSLCVEVLMQAVRDRRRGHELSDTERRSLHRWAAQVDLSPTIVDADSLSADS